MTPEPAFGRTGKPEIGKPRFCRNCIRVLFHAKQADAQRPQDKLMKFCASRRLVREPCGCLFVEGKTNPEGTCRIWQKSPLDRKHKQTCMKSCVDLETPERRFWQQQPEIVKPLQSAFECARDAILQARAARLPDALAVSLFAPRRPPSRQLRFPSNPARDL
jgi:hypothetical protein